MIRRAFIAAFAFAFAFAFAGAADLPPQKPNHIVPRLMTILARWETCQVTAYKDNDGTFHIGYGHGNANNLPPFVDEHTVIKDCDVAQAILLNDLNAIYVPQLTVLLDKIGVQVNDYQFSALLDVLYNRGAGRLRGSKAYDWLKRPSEKWYMEHAAEALVISHVEGFIPLDVAKDKQTGIERTHLGLTLRRIDDASLFLTKP